MEEDEIINELPIVLRTEVASHLYLNTFSKFPFFKARPPCPPTRAGPLTASPRSNARRRS